MYIGALIIAVVFLTLAFHRIIIQALWFSIICGCGIIAILFGIPAIPQLLRSNPSFWASAGVGAIAGFVVVGILCASWIRYALIHFYLQDTIERSKQAAAKGKMW